MKLLQSASALGSTALLVLSLPAIAQLTSGHASDQSDTRERACRQSLERAQITASNHRSAADKAGKAMTIELLDYDGSTCTRCSSEQLYRNPLIWTCTVRWKLVPR